MTRQNKLIILSVYLLLLAMALPLYRMKRGKEEKRIKSELSATLNEINKIKNAELEAIYLKKLFPADADTTAFVEDLYSAAKQFGLKSHDASSEILAARPTQRGAQADELSRYRFKVAVEGNYRSIAEYIRHVQNLERFKRITEIKLAPGNQSIHGDITLELFSLKGHNVP